MDASAHRRMEWGAAQKKGSLIARKFLTLALATRHTCKNNCEQHCCVWYEVANSERGRMSKSSFFSAQLGGGAAWLGAGKCEKRNRNKMQFKNNSAYFNQIFFPSFVIYTHIHIHGDRFL